MARQKVLHNLLELEIDKLFEDYKIEEIIEIGKLLDYEIEKKRTELRSMVGDRYKDVLTASDAIKNMKTISEDIVKNIDDVKGICSNLLHDTGDDTSKSIPVDRRKFEERTLAIQVRLAIFMNEQIWMAVDEGNNLEAAQYYLLAQHIHMNISIIDETYLKKLPLLQQIRSNLTILKDLILKKAKEKLYSIELTSDDASKNLNCLMFLQDYNIRQILEIFIEHRKQALDIITASSYESVRMQVCAIAKSLITTLKVLHDCFISCKDFRNGIIWQQLEIIVKEESPPTLSSLDIPKSPLDSYIPDIISQFRPKCKTNFTEKLENVSAVLNDWLELTRNTIAKNLENCLKLITNIKGLYIIRKEMSKIELPNDWTEICQESDLINNFNLWDYFFQTSINQRADELITLKVDIIVENLQTNLLELLNSVKQFENSEADLRSYIWTEENSDFIDLKSKELTMKTFGFSQKIVGLCEKFDVNFLDVLKDISQYLYEKEYEEDADSIYTKLKSTKLQKLEKHIQMECVKNSAKITKFLENSLQSETDSELLVSKSLICARFLHAVTKLCPHFHRCCSLDKTDKDWNEICHNFINSSAKLWKNWINDCVKTTQNTVENQINRITLRGILTLFPKWDVIEIQEQTEENVFKSQLEVPLKPSLLLQEIVNKLNKDLSLILPYTLPKEIHIEFIERNVQQILGAYTKFISDKELNQKQALQFLFDIRYLATICIGRENTRLMTISQEICDSLRTKVDPFDLDVLYSYLQNNVRRAVIQTQVMLGCLMPSSNQLATIGVAEKSKEQEREPSILYVSVPSVNTRFPVLPVMAPSHKITSTIQKATLKQAEMKPAKKKVQDTSVSVRSSAAALLGGIATDWFS